MTEHNNPQILENIRQKIHAMAACESPALVQYDYAYLNEWIDAICWADVIDISACEGLRAEVLAALNGWVDLSPGPETPPPNLATSG